MIDTYGVTEADIRDIRYLPDRDVAIVRLKNWRKFPISGLNLFRAENDYISTSK